MTKRYKSEATAVIHEMMEDLLSLNHIDKKTMREFDQLCLEPVEIITAEEIRSIREREQVSQSVFAHYLNVSKDTISRWERGDKHPSGSSLKLLSLVKKKGLAAIT